MYIPNLYSIYCLGEMSATQRYLWNTQSMPTRQQEPINQYTC